MYMSPRPSKKPKKIEVQLTQLPQLSHGITRNLATAKLSPRNADLILTDCYVSETEETPMGVSAISPRILDLTKIPRSIVQKRPSTPRH